jgi:hypothetical protein
LKRSTRWILYLKIGSLKDGQIPYNYCLLLRPVFPLRGLHGPLLHFLIGSFVATIFVLLLLLGGVWFSFAGHFFLARFEVLPFYSIMARSVPSDPLV